jgi:iron complex transport system ATP-binding protein
MKSESICIETSALTIGYGIGVRSNVLLKDLNLHIQRGQLVCFMGPNGAGKSTLLRTLAGLQKALSGTIQYETGKTQSHFSLPEHVAIVLTDRITAVNMTAFEVIAFGRYPYLGWDVKLSSTDLELIEKTMAEFRIQHLKDNRIYELSDGQMQMVMIARAVVQDTDVILLDEPTAHLDLNNRLEIMNLLRRLAHQSNKAIVASTHELDLALQTADLIWLTGNNKTIVIGIPEDLVLSGAFDATFMFKGFDLKTGKVEHEAHRETNIALIGSGHAYLWTKNALERNGFTVAELNASHAVEISQGENGLSWVVDGKLTFNSLNTLIRHFA